MMPPYSKYYRISGRNLIAPLPREWHNRCIGFGLPADVARYRRTLSWRLTTLDAWQHRSVVPSISRSGRT